MSVNYSLGAGKPLISREQNYVLDRKLLTVHSEDRDVSKWPNANEFEIIMPQQLLNIQSMRLVEIETPFTSRINMFSNLNQNTKLFINYNNTGSKSITVPSGNYTGLTLAAAINAQLTIVNGTSDLSCNFTPNITDTTIGTGTFSFKSTTNSYTLDFSACPVYSCLRTVPPFMVQTENIIFGNTFNWGLPYILGFSKKQYAGVANVKLDADTTANLTPDTCMYMEIEKYNSYDEMYPCNQSNFDHNSKSNIQLINSNNSYQGKINSAFAKIPLITTSVSNNYVFESRNIGLQNITHYEPPLERLARLKFKFRYHDGRLVDFQNNNFNFTIEFNMLRDEMGKQYNVRIPLTYTL
jgi:hypothetical protein